MAGGGVSDDFTLASAYAHLRTLRLADGPDEVHKLCIARRELAPYMHSGERVSRADLMCRTGAGRPSVIGAIEHVRNRPNSLTQSCSR